MSEDITKTKLFEEAAAEAREASRRYWAQPGRKSYPVPWWPLTPPDAPPHSRKRKPRRRIIARRIAP